LGLRHDSRASAPVFSGQIRCTDRARLSYLAGFGIWL
jgi:hypothetical protein